MSADTPTDARKPTAEREVTPRQRAVLLTSILIVASCGIVYELIIGTVSSYLLGNSVYQFSLTIGFFMFAMGIGSYVSRFVMGRLVEAFIRVELALALIGGLCSITLFMLFPFAPWFYTAAQFGLIFAIGLLVGLEIPLLTRVLEKGSTTRESLSDVLSLDYIGALAGSVLFPILLLPSLGLITASFAIGLVNAAVAFFNVIWLRDHLRRPRLTMALVGLMVAALVVLTATASRITSYAQDHLYFDRIVYRQVTPYQTLVATNQWQSGDLRLFIDGHLQFSQRDEYRYHEALVHPAMRAGAPPRDVLVLGGGDGLAAREILRYASVERIDLVDLDPAMTDLGREFGPLKRLSGDSLASPKVHVFNADAFVFVRDCERRYDRAIVDFPDPHSEVLSKLYSTEFYAMLSRCLRPGAAVVSQSSSPFFARGTYWTIGETLASVFADPAPYSIAIPSFGVWGFHLVHKGGAPDEIQPLPEGLLFLDEPTWRAATVFPDDIGRPESGLEVNSIFNPVLYQVYARDLRAPAPR